MRRPGDAGEKRDGYGRMPNSVVKSGAWAKLHPKMKAVYGTLLGLLDRTMNYRHGDGMCRVSYGYPTQRQIANKSSVREADVPKITDLLEKLGLVIKTPWSIAGKPRVRYILLPPDHPTYSRIGYTCERIYSQVGKGWGLTRPWGHKKPHELPDRLQTHESPTRLHSTDIHRAKSSHIEDESSRSMGGPPAQGSTPRSASPPDPPLPLSKGRWSQLYAERGKGQEPRLLVALFTALPRESWPEYEGQLLADGYRLRDIEEAKQIATGVLPHVRPVR